MSATVTQSTMTVNRCRPKRSELRDYLRAYKRDGATWNPLGSTLRGYIRDGVPERPIDRTFARVDRLLRWEAGSAQRVFGGGQSVPLPTDPRTSASTSQLELAEKQLLEAHEAIRNALEALREASSHIAQPRL
jgi:hypothetical protein